MQEKIERLREKGIVLTIQRLAVLEFLEQSITHPTVEDIYIGLKERYPTISRATIYTTLELLKNANEIQELYIRKDRVCFDKNPKMHHHFFCSMCEKIFDINIDCPVSKQGCVDGHMVKEVQAYLYGVCKDCLGKGDKVK